MAEGNQELNKVSRISETMEESCKVIQSSLNFLIQHYRVKQLMDGNSHPSGSHNHFQEKLIFLHDIGYLKEEHLQKLNAFFKRYNAIKLAVSEQEVHTDFSQVKFEDANEEISNLDQAVTLYFRDYTELAMLLVRLKVNSF